MSTLHHDRVTVYERKEDREQTAVTVVAAGVTTTGALPSQGDNPSYRRHGIAVRLLLRKLWWHC